MKSCICLFLLILSSPIWADLQLRTSFFYDPSSTNTGTGTSSSGATITGTETTESKLTYRVDALNQLQSGFKFGYAFGSMTISKEETTGSSVEKNDSTIIFHGPGIGWQSGNWGISFFYYVGARESRDETIGSTLTKYEYRDSSGYEINLGYTYPLSNRISIGARFSRRSLSQAEVGVKVASATTETAYTLSEENTRVTNQILFAFDFRFF